jgi:quinol monooxygenase YgiN
VIVEYIRYDVDGNDADGLIRSVSAAGTSLIADPGCGGWEVARGVTDDTAIILRIEWESAEAVEAFKTTPGFKRVLDALAPYADAGTLELFRTVTGSHDTDPP